MDAVMSIHVPKPEYRDALIDSMHRFGAAMEGQPGLVGVHTLAEQDGTRLIGLAMFDSREAAIAIMPRARAAVEGDDFDLWEQQSPEGFRLVEV